MPAVCVSKITDRGYFAAGYGFEPVRPQKYWNFQDMAPDLYSLVGKLKNRLELIHPTVKTVGFLRNLL